MRRHSTVKVALFRAACTAVVGLVGVQSASARIAENWESVSVASGYFPAAEPTSGTPYTITTSGANGFGTWTAITSDPDNAYYAISPNGFGAGGSGNVLGEAGSAHDGSVGSMILQSPAFTLSDAASGGSISMTYVGGANGSNVPGNISGLGTAQGNQGFGFMGVALVDPSGNIVASSSGFTTAGAANGNAYTLNYSGLSPTTDYTFALIDDGTRNSNWGWNGIDNLVIPNGTLVGAASTVFMWVGTTGEFTVGSNWNMGTAPNDVNAAQAIINNGGTAQITASDTIGISDFYVGEAASGGTSGTVVQTGGSLTIGDNITIGRSGSVGTYNMSGGTLSFTGGTLFELDGSASGAPSVLNLSGTATIQVSNGSFSIGEGNGTARLGYGIVNVNASGASLTTTNFAQIWVGDNGTGSVGVLNVSAGSVTTSCFLSIGRQGATGTVNLSGTGTLTKLTSVGDVSIGEGTTGVGTLNQTGGNFQNTSAQTWLGEDAGATGTWNMSGGTANGGIILDGDGGNGVLNVSGTAALTAPQLIIAYNTGSTGSLNLSGGIITTPQLSRGIGTTAAVTLNGGTIQASSDSTQILYGFNAGEVTALAGGVVIDTNSHNVTISSSISSPAGVTSSFTKVGAGNLTIATSNSYTGSTQVQAGTLTVASPSAVSTGPVVLSNSTTLALKYLPAGTSFTGNMLNTTDTNNFTPVISNNGNTVQLTTTKNSESTSIFSPTSTALNDASGFVAHFTYSHAATAADPAGNSTGPADGITFTINGTGANALGGPGSNLGYGGITQSLGVAVDEFQNQLGTGENGTFVASTAPGGFDQSSNSVPFISLSTSLDVTIVYNGPAETLTETVTSNINGSSMTLVTPNVDLASLLGGTAGGSALGYIGFTGATGGFFDVQSISNFSFTNSSTPLANSLVLTNPIAVLPAASATLQLAASPTYSSGSVGPITVNAGGTLVISNTTAGGLRGVLTAPSITFNGSGGTLDITNNALDLTSPTGGLASVTAMAKTGYSNGAWTGAGITSSTAASDSTHLTAVGVILNTVDGNAGSGPLYGSGAAMGLFDGANPAGTDVLVKYTYYGDTNLDGKVDGSDYSRIDSAFAYNNAHAATPMTGWFNGDFNYDGVINGSDYTLIDNAFNMQGASFTSSVASPSALATAQLAGSGATSAVPEPATLGVLALGAMGMLGRRRHCR